MSVDVLGLDLEYSLTIAYRRNCECAPYFAARHGVLFPAVLETAGRHGVDAVDLFAGYARGVHARHEAGEPL